MIIGIGNDIIEKHRVEKACLRDAFLAYVYTDAERELMGRRKSVAAGNWCVKEAVAKALGTGFRGFKPRDIEVLRDELGKPFVILYGRAKEKALELGISDIFVSISDTKGYVAAVAVAEGRRI